MSEYHARMQTKNLFSAFIYQAAAGSARISIYISYFIDVLIPVVYFLPEKKLVSASE